MKILKKFNKKQRLIQLSDGSQWYINGVPEEEREELIKKFDGHNFRDAMCQFGLSIYYHDKISTKYDEEPHSTILDDIRGMKQPSESTVRKALIWSQHYPGEKHHYAIKSGGESASDRLYESDYCPTIIGPDGNDLRILLIKRYQKEFKNVLITEALVTELYKSCQSKKQQYLQTRSDARSFVFILFGSCASIRRRGKNHIKGAEDWSREKTFEVLWNQYGENKYYEDIISQKEKQINASLVHHFGTARTMKNIYEVRPGKSEQELFESSVKYYHDQIAALKDLSWIRSRIVGERAIKTENKQLQLFAA